MTAPTGRCQQCCSPRCAGPGLTHNPDTDQYEVCVAPDGGLELDAAGCLRAVGGSPDCGCDGTETKVVAGDRVTVTGTGSTADPYTVSVDPADLLSTETTQLIQIGPDGGLLLDCDAVSGCVDGTETSVIAGPGAIVNGTGAGPNPYVVSVPPSADTGNLITAGTDGFLYVDCDAVSGCGGGAVDCAALDACSIDNLGDVDTTTTPPGPGDLLVWDGTNWINTPAGCGIDTSSGTVGLTTDPWPYACPQTEGAAVYCDPATGRVHTDPPARTITMESALGSTNFVPGAAYCAAVPTPNVHHPLVADQPDRIVITNPDPCRPMVLDIEHTGRIRLDWDDDDPNPTDWLNIVGFDLLVNGVPIGLTQEYGVGANPNGAQSVSHIRHEPAPVVTIAPGGSARIGTRIYGLKTNAECELFLVAVNAPRLRVIGQTVA